MTQDGPVSKYFSIESGTSYYNKCTSSQAGRHTLLRHRLVLASHIFAKLVFNTFRADTVGLSENNIELIN